jgi:hypothetical protein
MFEQSKQPLPAPPPQAGFKTSREIYTMPDQFLIKTPSRNWPWALVWLGVSIVLIALIIGGIFLFKRLQLKPEPLTQGNDVAPAISATPETLSEEPITAPESETPPEQNEPEISLSEPLNPETPPPQALSELPSALDSDQDNFTDLEEELLGTTPVSADTDKDGYKDGEEVANLFNPRQGGGAKLQDSGLVYKYTNPRFGWSVFYPVPWLASPLDELNKEVIFTAATGEFIEISQQQNPEKLSLLDWYKTQAPGVSLAALTFESQTNSGLQALWASDHLTAYLALPNSSVIYLMAYNIGSRTELNFSTLFKMMVESFKYAP